MTSIFAPTLVYFDRSAKALPCHELRMGSSPVTYTVLSSFASNVHAGLHIYQLRFASMYKHEIILFTPSHVLLAIF